MALSAEKKGLIITVLLVIGGVVIGFTLINRVSFLSNLVTGKTAA